MNREEEILQAECFQWHWNTYHSERKMLHCNNNNSHNKIKGNQMKAIGVVPGVVDLELVTYGLVHFIELKVGRNKQSEDQEKFQAMVEARGFPYIVIRTIEEFKQYIRKLYGS